ncbi:hypothetical protein LB467_14375 [Salegentibacter sp. JZCK2]|uniref:hypothetical protein n=1 Tax=Salegentibacter tibetensis TaxID=2873600 RepID=UPI001CD03260|nr:hypothetical protein [Salegentibacter tibetensis]MBZ9730878.1 hypothetical protein [Salegentibacter tibetensis]
MKIEELESTNQISHSGYIICKFNNIHSLMELKEYYLRNGSFRELKNCGTETIREFLRLMDLKEEIKINESFSKFQEEKDGLLLIEFLKKGFISRRTHNICRANGIDSFRELEIYYNQFKTFRHLNRCGVKINNELLALCKQEFDEKKKEFINSINENLIEGEKNHHEELLINYINQDRISKRAFKICRHNALETIPQLKAFYKEHKTFQVLPNCGAKINKELKTLCKYNGQKRSSFLKEKKHKEIVKMEIILDHSNIALHKKTINKFIKTKFSLLSNSSKNSLSLYFNGKIFIPTH